MNYKVVGQLACMILLVALVGCVPSAGMETAPVRGIITLDGKPYTQGGSVVFRPELVGKMGTATIQDDGSFELSTYSLADGAVVGKHRVTVSPPVPDTSDDKEEVIIASPLPKKFRSPVTSDLVYEVKADITNDFPINLKSK